MKKTLFLSMALAFVIISMAGCQTTPEKEVVVQKDLEQMIEKGLEQNGKASPDIAEEKMNYSALCAHYGVPERFQKEFTEQDVAIHADIALELPETTALPMARVEATKFSQDQVYALFNALCGDTQMYLTPMVRIKRIMNSRFWNVRRS